MAWRNLRSEISEIFTELSSGEHLSEYVQGLIAARLTKAKERYVKWYAYLRTYRKRHPEKVREWARTSGRRLTLRKWAAEEPRLCKHCWQEFRRPLRGSRVYCSITCRDTARRAYLAERHAQNYEANREKTIARQKRWYQANKEKVLARYDANREQRAEQSRARYAANRETIKAKTLARYHAKRAAQKATQP